MSLPDEWLAVVAVEDPPLLAGLAVALRVKGTPIQDDGRARGRKGGHGVLELRHVDLVGRGAPVLDLGVHRLLPLGGLARALFLFRALRHGFDLGVLAEDLLVLLALQLVTPRHESRAAVRDGLLVQAPDCVACQRQLVRNCRRDIALISVQAQGVGLAQPGLGRAAGVGAHGRHEVLVGLEVVAHHLLGERVREELEEHVALVEQVPDLVPAVLLRLGVA